jgi:hypothetical protein
MPSRVPIKIFKLQQVKPGVFDLAQTRFLQGFTTKDIIINSDGSEVINIGQKPSNQPLAESTSTRVYTDQFGKFVILEGANKFYIRNPEKPQQESIDVFEFYVNPQRLNLNYQKKVTEIRTRGGWEIQHWGDELTEIRVEGKSGGTHRKGILKNINRDTTVSALEQESSRQQSDSGDGLRNNEDVTHSLAWQRLLALKKLYDIDHAVRNQEELTLLGIAVYDSFYVGYFTNFTGPNHDANDPYQFSYGFTFKVLYETNVSTFNPSVKAAVTAGTAYSFLKIKDLNL